MSQHMILIEPSANALDISETFSDRERDHDNLSGSSKGFHSVLSSRGRGRQGQRDASFLRAACRSRGRPKRPRRQDVYKIAYPVKPGENRFDVSLLSAAHRNVLEQDPAWRGSNAPGDASTVTLEGEGVESLGQEPQTQAHIYSMPGRGLYGENHRHGLAAKRGGRRAARRGPGQPQLEEKAARVYSRMDWVLGLAFAILGLGGVLLYRRSAA